ncbi:UNVERIFIED_CONTAM: bifunctional tryptophan synthase trp1, partial [Siphonaria sp. JEL0065]
PGHPRDAGISMAVIKEFAGEVPILGVCLGEQSIFEVYGGTVKYVVTHDGKGLYKGVSQGIEVTRYHSLAGDKTTLPDCLEITSTTPSGVVMGVRHKEFVMEGVQYHPESIAGEEGARLRTLWLKSSRFRYAVSFLTFYSRPNYVPTPKNERKRGVVGAGIPLSKISKMNSTGTESEYLHHAVSSPKPATQQTILERIAERRLRR